MEKKRARERLIVATQCGIPVRVIASLSSVGYSKLYGLSKGKPDYVMTDADANAINEAIDKIKDQL